MTEQTIFSGTPDDLKAMVAEAIRPLADQIRELQQQVVQRKLTYTVSEVANQMGCSAETIRSYIRQGRTGGNGKKIRLNAKEPTPGHFRILPADLDRWLSQF